VSAFRFLFDEHVSGPAFNLLAADGIDVRHVAVIRGTFGGLEDDPAILAFAADEGRIVITRNYRDFAPLVDVFNRQGRAFSGVLFVPTSIAGSDVTGHVEAIKSWLAEATDGRGSVQNTYGWLSSV